MWERRDLQLIGVLALREIILALERERSNFGRDDSEQELTAGNVCRRNCFTVKVILSDVQDEAAVFWYVLSCRRAAWNSGGKLLWCLGI